MQDGARQTHPPGLYVLFFTEMWERYSFYSMMAILALYMDEALKFSSQQIGQVYGGYIGAVYFLPLLGGFLADRVLGFNRAVIIGGVLMAAGHFCLAIERMPFFVTALALLAFGTGLLKPNVSTIVGNLYRDRPALRDAGFNIFYMGINLGAFFSPIVVAYLRAHYGWGVAFASAGVAMGISLATFIVFNRHVREAAQRVDATDVREQVGSASPRDRVNALLVIFAIAIVFWMAFYQNGFTLTFWARDNTATGIAPETFQSVEPFFIIAFTPMLVWLWSFLRRRNAEPPTVKKFLFGMVLTAGAYGMMSVAGLIGGDTGRVSAGWLIVTYAVIALGEICLSPMGLSLVSKVAPPQYRGLMMGAWFVTLSTGGYLAGTTGGWWPLIPHSVFFALVALASLAAAGVLLLVMRRLHATFAAAGAS